MTDLINYEFEEETVRVVMIAGEPWFIANDAATTLGYRDAHNMSRNLDDDEKGTHIVSTLGGTQEHSIISESGLFAAILKSRKPEAKRFRKWVTSEVLPSLRRTGSYRLHEHEPPPSVSSDYDPPRLMASVAVVREARRLFGTSAARNVWAQLGLPISIAHSSVTVDGDPMADPLKDFLTDRDSCTIQEAAEGMGITDIDNSTRYRIGALLRLWGWFPRKVRRGSEVVNLFQPMGMTGNGGETS